MNVGHIYDSHICMNVHFIYLLKKIYLYEPIVLRSESKSKLEPIDGFIISNRIKTSRIVCSLFLP